MLTEVLFCVGEMLKILIKGYKIFGLMFYLLC